MGKNGYEKVENLDELDPRMCENRKKKKKI